MEQVILVDEHDRPIGVEDKLAAHRGGGHLHRAFSVFVSNARGELLLQRRSARKYHFAGAWANACCGHPRPGEDTLAAARRRLREELGIDVALREALAFQYSAADAASGLSERELDHVLVGSFDGEPRPDPAEVEATRWIARGALDAELARHPERFAPWFHDALARLSALGFAPRD